MVRILKIMMLIGALLCITGCGEAETYTDRQESTEATSTETVRNSETTAATTGRYTIDDMPKEQKGAGSAIIPLDGDKEMVRLGVSKKLVFICDKGMLFYIDPDILERFNELLVDKYGCDFVVEFRGYNIATNKYGYTYYDALKDTINSGEQTDIIMSLSPASYTKLIKEGYFIDIKEYMETTQDGKKLYEAYEPVIWETVEYDDGNIYGYAPFAEPGGAYYLVCNKKKAESTGINVSEGFSFYDIGKILEGAEVKQTGAYEICATQPALMRMLGYEELSCGIVADRDETGEWRAINPLLDDEFVKLCKTLREYREKGWLTMMDSIPQEDIPKLMKGGFIFNFSLFSPDEMADGKMLYTLMEGDVIHDVIVGDVWYQYLQRREGLVYGVHSRSEHTEEALRLITLINTEEELVRLLRYGIEGAHYVYEDGKVIQLANEYSGMGDVLRVVNPMLYYPEKLEPENIEEYYRELAKNYEFGGVGEAGLSPVEYVEVINSRNYDGVPLLEQIYDEYYMGLLYGAYEDVDATIAEVLRLQDEAGINEIIEAVNGLLNYGGGL